MKKYSKILSILLILAILIPGIVQAVPLEGGVKRLSGPNRVQTAINVSKEAYKNGADTIVLAGYKGSADALTGTLLAFANNAPLLLASNKTLSKELKSEIIRLGAKKVYILGGTTAVPQAIENELKLMNLVVERVSGANRFATASKIAERATHTKDIFLALGVNRLPDGTEDALADALAIGPVSAKRSMPVLLTQKNRLPKDTKDAIKKLGVKNVTIVGGEFAITTAVENELRYMGLNVDRTKGINRYDTATTIAKKYFTESTNTIVANGSIDVDALVGGYLGALTNSPVLLSSNNRLPDATKDYIKNNSKGSYVLGGEKVITNKVFKEIQFALGIDFSESTDLEVHFIDVGQGDSILIKQGGSSMLIDAGDNGYGKTVVNYLNANNIQKLDYVIGTHPHADHIGGLDDVINTFDIGKVIMPKVTSNTKTFEDVITAIRNKGLKITTPVVGDTFELEGAKFTILGPNSEKYGNLNNYSVVVKLEYGENSFLFTGDVEALAEKEVLDNGLNIKADVLKVAHHGSDTSNTDVFLNKVNPKYAVIQVGENNRYKHPDNIVLERLKARNITTYRNDLNGTVLAISDGNIISFKTEK